MDKYFRSFHISVFTSEDEMGEYGGRFSKIYKHFPEAVIFAKDNAKNVKSIVINSFSESFMLPSEMFDVIVNMKSDIVII